VSLQGSWSADQKEYLAEGLSVLSGSIGRVTGTSGVVEFRKEYDALTYTMKSDGGNFCEWGVEEKMASHVMGTLLPQEMWLMNWVMVITFDIKMLLQKCFTITR
jgi:hypothetical protein